MRKQTLSAVAGFLLLFFFYHAAEYMILFHNSSAGFLMFQLLFFVAAYLIAKWQFGRGLGAWGLDTKKRLAKHLLLGMLMGCLLYGAVFGVSLLAGAERIVRVPTLDAMVGPLSLFLIGNLFSSFSEDVLTRGYVYRHLNKKLSNGVMILVSATIYLLNHIYRLDDGTVTYTYLFCLGVLYVIPLLLTRRLWFTGGMHWAGNVTFYFTHEIMKVEEADQQISPNIILIGATLLFIPLNYVVIRAAKLMFKESDSLTKNSSPPLPY